MIFDWVAMIAGGCCWIAVSTNAFYYHPPYNSIRNEIVTSTATFLSTSLVKGEDKIELSKQEQDYDDDEKSIVSLLLWISYDGGRFTGWSSTNQEKERKGQSEKRKKGFVRSVQYAIQQKLAQVYGKIDENLIVVEGTSRTDKGVHAQMMVAQVYGLTTDWKDYYNHSNSNSSIPGKALPHPKDGLDDNLDVFRNLPKTPSNLVFVLNRMLPHDISIRGYHLPPSFNGRRPFHPSHNALSKTYQYIFSIGPIPDPTQWRSTWHNYPEKHQQWNASVVNEACKFFEQHHTLDFRFYRGAPRGKEEQVRFATQSTICTLHRVSLTKEEEDEVIPGLATYHLTFTGDRFLYKMVRFLAGAFYELGVGKMSIEEFQQSLLNPPDDQSFPQKPICAPAHGLSLINIDFGNDVLPRDAWKS